MAEFKPPLYGLTKDEYNLATSTGPVANGAERTKLANLLKKRETAWKKQQKENAQTSSKPATSSTTTSTTVAPADTEWSPEDGQETTTETEGTVTQDYQVYATSKFNEAYAALRQMPLKERIDKLKTLRSKGFGGTSEVSASGISEYDINRYKELLILQDVSNLPMKDLWGKVNSMETAVKEAASRRTPIKDVDSILDEVMKRDLGRTATKEELQKFRAAYSGMEAGGNAPSLTAAAESQVETVNPEETQAAQFAEYASTFEKMLRGA